MKDNQDHIRYRKPASHRPPKKILAIRLQATGDVVISLPYLQSLREQLPVEVQLDLLVREECRGVPEQLTIFNEVHVLKGGRNTKLQLLHFLWMYPRLFFKGYDVLLDLQNHRLSKVMRLLLGIKAWTVFDRTSANYAGDRYKNTINVLELAQVSFQPLHTFRDQGGSLFEKFGLHKDANYIVINPAGAFPTRNLDMEVYARFCRLWREQVDPAAIFLMLGIPGLEQKAAFLQKELGGSFVSLVGRTTQAEAILLLKQVQLMISEDSGLLHMAYCVGTPSVGILGSTRNDWTNPQLPFTRFFHSSDLSCGNCMRSSCLHSDLPCLRRISAEMILNAARAIKDLRES